MSGPFGSTTRSSRLWLFKRTHWLQQRLWLAALVILTVTGCASTERLEPVPFDQTVSALPLGLANARFFPGVQAAEIAAEWKQSIERQRRAKGLSRSAKLHQAQFLAISGGSDNGAFGSGLLVGWTEAGNRPEFELVTGVSTGALIAPFAFLGPEYDRQLRDVYTTISAKDIFSQRMIVDAIYNDAMADTTPLWKLISRYVDQKMLDRIAEEYGKGRLLLIGSTDLDAQRPSIWNIGAIAASKDPRALDLVRKILRASAAVPGLFQPVMIDVDLNGHRHQEMHVDGGAIAQMFLYPPNIDLREIADRDRKAYLIYNARHDPEWASVERRTLSIAGRAISTMIHSSGSNDILRIYNTTKRDGVDYNLAYIGSDFTAPHTSDFDRVYMNALFDYAYKQARAGYPWRKTPAILSGDQ